MKCPNCGRDNEEGGKFCKYCGCPLNAEYPPPYYSINMNPPESEKKRKFKARLRAVLVSVLFVFLLFGCQSCVTSGYTFSLMSGMSVKDFASSESVAALYEEILAKVTDKTTMILFIANLLTVFIVCLLFRMRGKNPRSEVSAYAVNPLRVPTFALFGIAMNVFISITISLIPFSESVVDSFNSTYAGIENVSSASELIFSVLSVAIVTGITEELIFRGISMKRLVPAFGKVPSVIITALIFGLAHGTPIAIGYAFLIGLLFGYMYVSYGSIVPSVVCHIFFNMTSFLLPYVPDYSLIFLYIISAALIILLSYRMFVRHPVFSDIVYDRDNIIKPINEHEREIISTLKSKQMSGDIDSEEMLTLMEDWEKNRREEKENKRKSNKK